MNPAPSSLDVSSLRQHVLDGWPGVGRRHPRLSDPTYLVFKPLAEQICASVEDHFPGRRDLRVLDVGCGAKPFFPLVAPWAVSYRGLDPTAGPMVDDVGTAERMPYDDEQFDLLLCTQVLEHVRNPDAAVAELARVVKPGGLVLASTHGVYFYHPSAANSVEDLWRWTHTGLVELFRRNAAWQRVEVQPNRNMIACMALLLCVLLSAQTRRRGLRTAGKLAVGTINAAAAYIDDRFPRNARVPDQGSMSANYLVSAVR